MSDSVFDANWKEVVEDRVSGYSSLSEEAGENFLYICGNIKKGRLQNVLENGKITRLVVVME